MITLPEKNILLFIFSQSLILLLLGLLYLSNTGGVYAQDPYPDPYVPCTDSRGEEDYHSLRPFQASPCMEEQMPDTALFCGNTLVWSHDFTANYAEAKSCVISGTTQTCHFKKIILKTDIEFAMTGVELPIMGNTEDVLNSQNRDKMDNADKVNEYVSWYLNGVTYRAEYPYYDMDQISSVQTVIDYSGPIKKLLPWDVAIDLREETVNRAVNAKSSGNDDQARHDQVVACVYGFTILGKTIGGIPAPCYEGGLKGWLTEPLRLKKWEGHIPPKFSDPKYQGDFLVFWKDYQEWRGNFCFLIRVPNFIPIIGGWGFNLCGQNPFSPDYYANLFPYIPFSTTEDRVGLSDIKSSDVQEASSDLQIYDVELDSEPADLFFSHMQEADELAEILQSTYVAKDEEKEAPVGRGPSAPYCDFANVRTNPGDNLFPTSADDFPDGKWPGGIKIKKLEYTAEFDCTFGYPIPYPYTCKKTAQVTLDTETKTPLVDKVWSRLVAGPQSVFKRFFPKEGPGAPVEKILDIPASSRVNYQASEGSLTVIGPKGQRGNPELYFPHIGGIYEYFLHGIQTALRPKGMGYDLSSGHSTSTKPPKTNCQYTDVPALETPQCSLSGSNNNIRGTNLPPLMKAVIESAATKYGVPPDLIAGVMYSEGGFEPRVTNAGCYGEYTEENIKNAILCEFPNCNPDVYSTPCNYDPSQCDSAGPYQELRCPWSDPNEHNRCNFYDSTIAQARKLSKDKYGIPDYSISGDKSTSCVGINYNTGSIQGGNSCSKSDWDCRDVITALRFETGYCDIKHFCDALQIYGACNSGCP